MSVVQFDRGDHGADRTRAPTLWLLSRTRGGNGAVHARVGACPARLALLGSRGACNLEVLRSESHARHAHDESVPWVVDWDAFRSSWQQVCKRSLARAAPARSIRAQNGLWATVFGRGTIMHQPASASFTHAHGRFASAVAPSCAEAAAGCSSRYSSTHTFALAKHAPISPNLAEFGRPGGKKLADDGTCCVVRAQR